jgi:lipopolysaccharide transport system ATP-binding protein
VNADPSRRSGSGELRFTSIIPTKGVYRSGEQVKINFSIQRMRSYTNKYAMSCRLFDQTGTQIVRCDSRLIAKWIVPSDDYQGSFVLKTPWLRPGTYRIGMSILGGNIIDRFDEACSFEVVAPLPYADSSNPHASDGGQVFADFDFEDSEYSSTVSGGATQVMQI